MGIIKSINQNLITEALGSKELIRGTISINDLRDWEYDSTKKLTSDQKQALANFDLYRIDLLNSQESDESFHKTYTQLQVMSNLIPFKEFLKEEYR